MRRVLSSILVSALLASGLACDAPPPPGTTTEPSSTRGPDRGNAPVPSGLAPLSPNARADQPMGAQTTAATATAAPTVTEEPKQVAVQHVLLAYKGAKKAPKGVTRSKADAKKRAEEVAEKAKAGDDFDELVKKFSEDPGALDRRGSTGKFQRNVMAKPFEDAAFALEVGKVSGVVETEFGFHVLKRNQ